MTTLRELLDTVDLDLHEFPEAPSIGEMLACNINNGPNKEQLVLHYLRTEKDRLRLAYWCEEYLKLEW